MNVVFLSLESTRSDHFGPGSGVETPTIDRLCEKRVHFPNTFSQLPHTGNHGSILTGMLPKNNGIRTLGGALDDSSMPTAFSIFRENGYEVRTHLGSGMLKDRGFTEWGLNGSDSLSDVEGSLEEVGEDDFFLFIHYWNTHTPYRTELPVESPKDFFANLFLRIQDRLYPRGYMGRFEEPFYRQLIRYPVKYFWEHRQRRVREVIKSDPERVREGYRDSIKEADRYIEELLSMLEERGLLEDTLVVVFGDHGESFNEHGERNEIKRYSHGSFLYDNATNVPLVFWSRNEDLLEAEKHEKLGRSIDILPTVAELADLEAGNDFDGINLLEDSPDYAFAETHENDDKAMLRTQDYKIIRNFDRDENEFYDLGNDPDEEENIADEKSSIIEEKIPVLKELLGDFRDREEEEEIKSRLKDLGYRD